MAITIIDSGATILITNGALAPRNILKTKIVELTIVKTNILKIDIGGGALHNIFLPHASVTVPATASPTELKDAINQMLAVNIAFPEAKLNEQITWLNMIYDLTNITKSRVAEIADKIFYQPLLVDDGGQGIIYKGYAMDGSSQEMNAWAIERIKREGDVFVHTWAEGSRNFSKRWIDRESLIYF